MSTGLISKKYLIDIANAIRVKLDSESTYTPAQMATAIANIDGTIAGTITKSQNADVGVITDTLLDDICDALRTQLGDNTLSFTPSQIADAILTISSGGSSVDIVPFSSGTDEQIVAMIQAAHNGDIDLQQDGGWAVGDTRSISVSAFTAGGNVEVSASNRNIVISSFDDYQNCGCVMQFDFKQGTRAFIRMNNSRSNAGGYGLSEMKTTTLPAMVLALPNWLQNLLVEFSCLCYNPTTGIVESISGNKLALRSQKELYGSSYYAEGSQLNYYTTANNRKKIDISTAVSVWTRTPDSSSRYLYSKDDGSGVGYNGATSTYNIAPFGCI